MVEFLVEKIFLTKSSEWESEKEYRMISYLKESDRIIENNNQKVHLNHFEPKAVKSIYLGANMVIEYQDKIKSVLSEPRYHHVKVLKGELNNSIYKIDFTEVKIS